MQAQELSSHYLNIREEVRALINIGSILDKCELDGNISELGNTLQGIFEREIVYAVSELKKLKAQQKDFDLEGHFLRNTLIFKENLKIIALSLIESVYKNFTSKEKLLETISKATQQSYKGKIQSIWELEEEQLYKSQTVSCQEQEKLSLNLFDGISNKKILSSNEESSESLPFKVQSLQNFDQLTKNLREEMSKNNSGIQTPVLDEQGFKSFKWKFFKSNESIKYKSNSNKKDGSQESKKKKNSTKIDMKKKNCLHFGVINKQTVNLTQKFKTPRDDEKRKRRPTKLKDEKENSMRHNKKSNRENASFKIF